MVEGGPASCRSQCVTQTHCPGEERPTEIEAESEAAAALIMEGHHALEHISSPSIIQHGSILLLFLPFLLLLFFLPSSFSPILLLMLLPLPHLPSYRTHTEPPVHALNAQTPGTAQLLTYSTNLTPAMSFLDAMQYLQCYGGNCKPYKFAALHCLCIKLVIIHHAVQNTLQLPTLNFVYYNIDGGLTSLSKHSVADIESTIVRCFRNISSQSPLCLFLIN